MPDVYQGELGRPLLKGDVGVKTWRKLSPAEMKGSSLDTAHVVLAKKKKVWEAWLPVSKQLTQNA